MNAIAAIRSILLMTTGLCVAGAVVAQTPESTHAAAVSTPASTPAGTQPKAGSQKKLPRPAAKNAVRHRASPYERTQETEKAREYYPSAWGVDHLQAAMTSSGNLIRFTFRVVEPKRARTLGDHALTPYMYAPRTKAVLQVPVMEKIGQLRQLGNLEPNKEYWMVFSNKGKPVTAGDRVNVIVGPFHADGLLVE